MTSRPAPRTTASNSLHLVVAQAGPGSLERSGGKYAVLARHPEDGWRLADPYPLGRSARVVLRALIGALCPSGDGPHSPRLLESVEVGARRFLRYMHPTMARGLWLGLFILDWLPVLTFKSAGRLHRLRPERARAFVARWARSRFKAVRLLMTGVRSLVLSVYYDQADVHEAMGYRPIPFLRERIALRESLLRPARVEAE